MGVLLSGISGAALNATIKGLVEKHFVSKVDNWLVQHQANRKLVTHSFSNQLTEYLRSAYESNSYINTIVFQNQQKKLADLYVPLTLKSESENKDLYLIDQYKHDLFDKYKRIVIVDYAGMGKSTILKYMFLSCIEKSLAIPMLIELRRLKKDKSILDIIISDLQTSLSKKLSEVEKEFIILLIERGDFVFMLDGYDEIELDHRAEVINGIHEFIKKTPNSYFALTSRDDVSLTSFSSFQSFSIRKLDIEESFTLLRKYDRGGKLSENLISKLKDPELKPVHSFLENPLLTSLLYKSYEHKPMIPYRKDEFYRQVYDALFDRHDITKDGSYIRKKKTGLSIEYFHKVLRSVGFLGMKSGKISYSRDEIIKYIEEAVKISGKSDFLNEDFLYDICHSVPLFIKDGDQYKWAHKSLQDYFSASYICYDAKENQENILEKMSRSNRAREYYNVLDMVYDIDSYIFNRYVSRSLLERFLDFYDTSYTDTRFDEIDLTLVDERKSLTFLTEFLLFGKNDFFEHSRKKVKHNDNTHFDYQSVPMPVLSERYNFPKTGGISMNMTVEFPSLRYGIGVAVKPDATIAEIIIKKGVNIAKNFPIIAGDINDNEDPPFDIGGPVDDSVNFCGNETDRFKLVNDMMKRAAAQSLPFPKGEFGGKCATGISAEKSRRELKKIKKLVKDNIVAIQNLDDL